MYSRHSHLKKTLINSKKIINKLIMQDQHDFLLESLRHQIKNFEDD